jgi:hypothetical protein
MDKTIACPGFNQAKPGVCKEFLKWGAGALRLLLLSKIADLRHVLNLFWLKLLLLLTPLR